MKTCPKCGKRLRLWHVSQFCPACGVNLRFFGYYETFRREAKAAELSQAAVHVRIKRLKAALVGSRLAVLRLIASLLPAASLLVPAGTFGLKTPLLEGNFALSGLGVFGFASGVRLKALLDLSSGALVGAPFAGLRNLLFLWAGIAVFALAVLLCTLLCFVSVKNMQKVICGVSLLGFVYGAFFIVYALTAGKALQTSPFALFRLGVGAAAPLAAFAAVFLVNLLLEKKGINPDYAEGMEERVRIRREVKAGRIRLDDLPQPVVETAETREIEERIAMGRASSETGKTPPEAERGREAT